jgi:zinc protease
MILALAADPTIAFDKFTLDNGLEVIVHEDHRLPIVAVNVTYHVGAIDEPRTRTGFAHLYEHLMFQGSKHVADEAHFRLLTNAGASLVNGSTHNDFTNYVENVPANQLALALWLEADRMGYLLDTLDQKKLDNQRLVVKNERRQRYENQPYGLVMEAVQQNLFPPSHPYHGGVIGSMAHLDAASMEDVKNFYRTFYVPSNATLTLAGDVTLAQAKALVEKYFGTFPKRPAPQHAIPAPPGKPQQSKVVLEERLGQLARVTLAWATPPVLQPGDAALDFAADVLAQGKSSRLYRALVLEQKIAQDVDASQQGLGAGSMFTIEATGLPGVTCEQLDAALTKVLAEMRQRPPTAEELARVRNRFETSYVSALQSIGGMHGRANLLQLFNHYTKDPGGITGELARHRAVTEPAIADAQARYLSDDKRLTVWSVPTRGKAKVENTAQIKDDAPKLEKMPEVKGEGPLPEEAFRQVAPPAGPTPQLTLPAYQSVQLANKLTVMVAESHQLPLVAAVVSIRAGATLDPSDKPGLAQFTFDVLDEGAAGKDTMALDDAMAGLGSEIRAGGTRDGGFVSALVLKRNLDRALAIAADVVLRPTFAAADVERIRGQRISDWVGSTASPSRMGLEQLIAQLYGRTHPYGHPQQGTHASLTAITREDLVAFHAREFGPDRAAVIFVGDITLAEAKAVAEKTFGAWKSPLHKAEKLLPVIAARRKQILLYERPQAPQTFIAAAAPTFPVGHPDEEALDLVSDVFGGQFASRLNLNLREDKGITYGASSSLNVFRGTGLVLTQTSVRAEETGVGVSEIFAEMQRLHDKPVTEDELAQVKSAAILSLSGEFENLFAVAQAAGNLFLYRQPLDYYAKAPARVTGVTLAQARAAADKYFAPNKMQVVLVGDPALITKQVAGLKLGELQDIKPLNTEVQ